MKTKARKLVTAYLKAGTDPDASFEIVAYDPHSDDIDDLPLAPAYVRTAPENFRRRGRNLALRWAHNMTEPNAAIGLIDRVWTDDLDRLMVSGRFDLDNNLALSVWEGVLFERITEASISWDTLDDGSMELIEVSIVSAGANRGTGITCAGSSCGGKSVWPSSESLPCSCSSDDENLDQLYASIERMRVKVLGRTPPRRDSVSAFRARILREHPDDDDIREVLRLPTTTSIAKAAEAKDLAAVVAQNTAALGTPKIRVRIDQQMRGYVDESDQERRDREVAAFRAKQLAEEEPIRVPAWTRSDETSKAPDSPTTVVFDGGSVVRTPKSATHRAATSAMAPANGFVWSMPLYAATKGESA